MSGLWRSARCRRALPEARCPSRHPLDSTIRCTLPAEFIVDKPLHVSLWDDPADVHAAFDKTGRFVYHQWTDARTLGGCSLGAHIVVGNPHRYRFILVNRDGTTFSSNGDMWERYPRPIRYSTFWWQDFWRYTIRRKLRWT